MADLSELTDKERQELMKQVKEMLIGSKYRIIRFLGSGGWARVYEGRDIETGGSVAMKFEDPSKCISHLKAEFEAYKHLNTQVGFPKALWFGNFGFRDGNDVRTMVFELLGPNLADLLFDCGGKFSLKTTLMLALQLLDRLEALHHNGYIHRDIKPENLMVGPNGKDINTIYIADLGIASQFRVESYTVLSTDETAKLAPPQMKRVGYHLTGTARFASVNQHCAVEHHARDDLEALGYLLVYFLKGRLPWDKVKHSKSRESKHRRMGRRKQAIKADKLCHGLPSSFFTYMEYILTVQGAVWPDYNHLRGIFKDLFVQQGFQNDHVYDWTLLEFAKCHDFVQLPKELICYKQAGVPDNDAKPQWSEKEFCRLSKRAQQFRARQEHREKRKRGDGPTVAVQTRKVCLEETLDASTVNEKTVRADR